MISEFAPVGVRWYVGEDAGTDGAGLHCVQRFRRPNRELRGGEFSTGVDGSGNLLLQERHVRVERASPSQAE